MAKKIFLSIFVAAVTPLALLLTYETISLIIGDIEAGALQHQPETGWGFAIATFIGPIDIAIIAFDIVAFQTLREKLKSSPYTGFEIAVSAVLVLAIAAAAYAKYGFGA